MSAGPPASRPAASPRIFYGWTIVGVAFLATFAQVAFFNPTIGVFQPSLHDEFGWSRAQIAGAITLGSVSGGLLSPFFGAILDRHGARWVIAGSAIAMVVALALLAEQRELWQFYILFALGRALAQAAVGAAAVVAVSNWFIRRRPLAIAIGTLGIRVGAAALPLLAALVITHRSWPDGFRTLALMMLVVNVVPPLLLLRRRPEDMNLRPDGDPPPLDAEGRLAATSLDPDWTLPAAVRTRAYWLLGAAVSLAVFGNGAVNFHQIPHLVDQGLSTTDAALVVTLSSISGALGGLLSGVVAIRLRARWTMAGALVLQCGGILLLLAVDSLGLALVYAIWQGFFLGVTVTQLQVVYADYFGRLQIGLIRGSFQPIALGFNAAGPLVVGLWFDRAGSYSGPFTLIIALFLVASLALVFARYPSLPPPVATR